MKFRNQCSTSGICCLAFRAPMLADSYVTKYVRKPLQSGGTCWGHQRRGRPPAWIGNWKEKLQRKAIVKSGHLEIYCQGTIEALALFCTKAGRVALQVCVNMKMRKKGHRGKVTHCFSMCTGLGQAIPDLISSNWVLDKWGQWEYGGFGVRRLLKRWDQKNQKSTSFWEVLKQSQGVPVEQESQGLHSMLVTQYASWMKSENQETAAVNLSLNNSKASIQVSKEDITYSKILSQPHC